MPALMNKEIPYPKKSLGQNFLVDPNYQRKIIAALKLDQGDHVMEIGPGWGAITRHIIQRVAKLYLVEKDDHLAQNLEQQFASPRIKIIHGDFLKINLQTIADESKKKIKVVGNLPYNIASQIFFRLIENRDMVSDMFLMFQREVAKRFVAKPGTREYGLLSLWQQVYTDCTILFDLPPTAFKPKPRVKSSFLHFTLRDKNLLGASDEKAFWHLMKILFQGRRKTLRSVLKKKGMSLQKMATLDGSVRAETLDITQLIKIFRHVAI